MTTRGTWTCEACGKLTDGRPGIDDAMDCLCARCHHCGDLFGCCECDLDDEDEA